VLRVKKQSLYALTENSARIDLEQSDMSQKLPDGWSMLIHQHVVMKKLLSINQIVFSDGNTPRETAEEPNVATLADCSHINHKAFPKRSVRRLRWERLLFNRDEARDANEHDPVEERDHNAYC
jgi:hypothetical protein